MSVREAALEAADKVTTVSGAHLETIVDAALSAVLPDDLFIAPRAGYDGSYIWRLTEIGRVEVASNRTTGMALWEALAELIPASVHDCPSCAHPLPPQDESDLGWSCRSCKTYGVPEDLT